MFPDEGPLRRELYPKHVEFLNGGGQYDERIFFAANQIGKTYALLIEGIYHATGLYPHWWKGKRFNRSTVGAFGAKTWEMIRRGIQAKLLTNADQGELELGTGIIPGELLEKAKFVKAQGIPDTYSELHIPHVSGSMSKIIFITYDSGLDKWKSFTADWVCLDEEPPFDIYVEASVRVLVNDGTVALGFTCDENLTETILHFFTDGEFVPGPHGNRLIVNAGWDDVPHLSEKKKAALKAVIPPYLLDSKTKGLPSAGRGAIFPFKLKDFVIEDFEVKSNYKRIYIVNPGVTKLHILWAAIHPFTSAITITKAIKVDSTTPYTAIELLKEESFWCPGIVNNVYDEVSKAESSYKLAEFYQNAGLDISVIDTPINGEAGNDLIKVYLADNKLKFTPEALDLRNEMQMYHRIEDGTTGKTPSGLIDCLKILVMYGMDRAMSISDYDEYMQELPNYDSANDGRSKVTGY
jgi:phage terminase large subunit-like protein